MTNAWMLRNDGVSFPVSVHLYTMEDDDFSSEAEVASFLIRCGLADHTEEEYCLDAWMAKLIRASVHQDMSSSDIDTMLEYKLNHLHYRFPYPLTTDEYLAIHMKLNNWSDFDSWNKFRNEVTIDSEAIWKSIKQSEDQQFCRARFGGKYDSIRSSGDMWFRISSLGFNWSDVIYTWVANNVDVLNIGTVSVCRDTESDYGFDHAKQPDYFYRSKGGATYYLMPIDEFLSGEHESNPVFAQMEIGRGPRRVLATMLGAGYAISAAEQQSGLSFENLHSYYLKNERRQCECVQASAFLDEAHPKVQFRIAQLVKRLKDLYSNLSVQDIDQQPYAYATGRIVDSLVITYTLDGHSKSNTIQLIMNKGLARTTVDELLRQFRMLFKS